jgi:site-specific recombinase
MGQAVDLLLLTIPELRDLYKKANKEFSLSEYWKHDWNKIIGIQIFGAMLILGLDQFLHWKPQTIDYIKWCFGGGGMIISTVASRYGRYKKLVMNVIDKKTNIADGIEEPKTNP